MHIHVRFKHKYRDVAIAAIVGRHFDFRGKASHDWKEVQQNTVEKPQKSRTVKLVKLELADASNSAKQCRP